MKRFNLKTGIIGVACLVGFLFSFPASFISADQPDIDKLREDIAKLENRIKALEFLLQECQDSQKGILQGWQDKKNWRKLQVGMPEERVKTLLGEPIKVISGTKTFWYYPNFYGGHVSFDEKGQVAGWNEP